MVQSSYSAGITVWNIRLEQSETIIVNFRREIEF